MPEVRMPAVLHGSDLDGPRGGPAPPRLQELRVGMHVDGVDRSHNRREESGGRRQTQGAIEAMTVAIIVAGIILVILVAVVMVVLTHPPGGNHRN